MHWHGRATRTRELYAALASVPDSSLPRPSSKPGMDDSADILGGELRVAKHDRYNLWSTLSFLEQLLMLGAVVVVVVSAQHLYPIYKQYQEKRYRKCVIF